MVPRKLHPRPHEKLIEDTLANLGFSAVFTKSSTSPVGSCLLVQRAEGALRLEVIEEGLKWLLDHSLANRHDLIPDDSLDFGHIVVKLEGDYLPPQEVCITSRKANVDGIIRYIGWLQEDLVNGGIAPEPSFCQRVFLDILDRGLLLVACIGSYGSCLQDVPDYWSRTDSILSFLRLTRLHAILRTERYHANLQHRFLKPMMVGCGLRKG